MFRTILALLLTLLLASSAACTRSRDDGIGDDDDDAQGDDDIGDDDDTAQGDDDSGDDDTGDDDTGDDDSGDDDDTGDDDTGDDDDDISVVTPAGHYEGTLSGSVDIGIGVPFPCDGDVSLDVDGAGDVDGVAICRDTLGLECTLEIVGLPSDSTPMSADAQCTSSFQPFPATTVLTWDRADTITGQASGSADRVGTLTMEFSAIR